MIPLLSTILACYVIVRLAEVMVRADGEKPSEIFIALLAFAGIVVVAWALYETWVLAVETERILTFP